MTLSLPPRSRLGRSALALAGTVALVAGGSFAANAAPTFDNSNNNSSKKLRTAVTVEKVVGHLTALDAIAEANGDTRASGTEGYSDSVDYIVGKLTAAGYKPTVQPFTFPYFAELSPAVLAQTTPDGVTYGPDDVATMTFSGAGAASGVIKAVDTTGTASATGTSGCEASDFVGFPDKAIALVQRGSCTFAVKAANAEAAGASAVIIFNTGVGANTGPVAGTLGAPDLVGIPVVGASFAAGTDLIGDGVTGSVVVDTVSENRETYNVIAETATGNPDNVVMVGAHLDSVLAGPGINDNGTGSAGILAVAEGMSKVKPANKVRFAWWGAEEEGLLGAEHYVADLVAKDQLDSVGLYLNFDMIGSPNFGRFVYDGDNSAFPVGPGAAAGPAGSGQIEQDFHDYFASVGLASGETAFSGRSDYGPFIAEGIPAGGLFTGAEGIKTAEQAELFGGEAGAPYDACYHAACDDTNNLSIEALDQLSDAVAHLTISYAMSTVEVNGAGAPAKGKGTKDRFEGNPLGGGTESGGGLHPEHDHDHEVADR
ncbi:M28 family peptidase [Arthrobacter sp. L77]|uniref:M28 family peptidase n=1 Tax=Arthrobacter sp. L77 TaxID=1496689 RepID=UPI0005BDBE1F|nr:M28 family peptidase [Arthrobacter sp. L77]